MQVRFWRLFWNFFGVYATSLCSKGYTSSLSFRSAIKF